MKDEFDDPSNLGTWEFIRTCEPWEVFTEGKPLVRGKAGYDLYVKKEFLTFGPIDGEKISPKNWKESIRDTTILKPGSRSLRG